MAIFPFIEATNIAQQEELPLFKEYAWDYNTDEMILKDGKTVIVEGNEALKVWIYKALKTKRYAHAGYSWNYGSEIESIIGQGYSRQTSKNEIERLCSEALMINPYIATVNVLNVQINNDSYMFDVRVSTVYGELEVNEDV
ncbi:DUF2634 domain-containing protein [Paenibacillus spongiae]|uniref:DUF2634 domain-containing protein n=1 Tax=Paenibacillus spongiae TaxID=2909671 RepID=A0ABY5SDQ3_9BACL|nr:DUF2634 domain-containing protein [Paenibacillus spongiae]UVI32094.1 DUF2634 domain-containing protein [Paenibacillus spongiae]